MEPVATDSRRTYGREEAALAAGLNLFTYHKLNYEKYNVL